MSTQIIRELLSGNMPVEAIADAISAELEGVETPLVDAWIRAITEPIDQSFRYKVRLYAVNAQVIKDPRYRDAIARMSEWNRARKGPRVEHVSLSHVTTRTQALLEAIAVDRLPIPKLADDVAVKFSEALTAHPGDRAALNALVAGVGKDAVGHLVLSVSRDDRPGVPEDVVALWAAARAMDAPYVALVPDGPVLEGLATWPR